MLLCAFFGSASEGAEPNAAGWVQPSAGVPAHVPPRVAEQPGEFSGNRVCTGPRRRAGADAAPFQPPRFQAERKFQRSEHPSAREQGPPPPPPLDQLRAKERRAPPAPRQPGAAKLGPKFGQPGAAYHAKFGAGTGAALAARGGGDSSSPREFVPVPKKKHCRAGATPPPPPSRAVFPARSVGVLTGPRHLLCLNI
jgi:hypothetical protein